MQVHKFTARFSNIPDMLELDHLTVSGDVTFGKDVVLKVTGYSSLLFHAALFFHTCGSLII